VSTQVAQAVVAGRVVAGGTAMEVTRRPGMVMVRLTCMPGHPAAACAQGGTGVILFPGPVPAAAGTWVLVVIEWLPSGSRDDAGPVVMPRDAVLDRAHVRR
jgi:hypothetical protein